MLTYQETIWKKENGFKTRNVQLDIRSIQPSETLKDQRARIEKLSLVAFLSKEQRRSLIKVSRGLKRNDSDFYQNSNLHVTVLGFGPLEKKYHKTIQRRIQKFSTKKRSVRLTVKFNTIRPGTLYSNNKKLDPVSGPSNGTVIALGHFDSNKEFCNYSNELAVFLLKDKTIKSVLGSNFRKKLPSVWCTLGYYDKPRTFTIGNKLENIFKQNDNLRDNSFKFSISEISLVRSKYKNLRNPAVLYKFKV